jgi:hypothetical protein
MVIVSIQRYAKTRIREFSIDYTLQNYRRKQIQFFEKTKTNEFLFEPWTTEYEIMSPTMKLKETSLKRNMPRKIKRCTKNDLSSMIRRND